MIHQIEEVRIKDDLSKSSEHHKIGGNTMIDTNGIPRNLLKDSEWLIKEIEQQPQKWLETFKIVKKNKRKLEEYLTPGYDVIMTGAGTSEYAGGTIVKELNLKGDRQYMSVGSPDIVTHPYLYYRSDRKTILVQFSRSGVSPESLGTIEHADAIFNEVKHLFLLCNAGDSKMMDYANAHPDNVLVLTMPDGVFDQSYAMTSSFTCMQLAAYLCFNLDKLDELEKYVISCAKIGEKILKEDVSGLRELITSAPFEKANFLGSGNLKSMAMEADIKVLEVSAGRLGTWHDSIPGFRHGPMGIVESAMKNTLTVIFYENDNYVNQYADDILMEIRSLGRSGNKVLALTPRHTKATREYADYEVFFDDHNLPSVFLPLLISLTMHIIMMYRGWLYGIGSDCPFGRGSKFGVKTVIYPIKGN